MRFNLFAVPLSVAFALAGCGVPEDQEPLDDEYAVDEHGLLVYPSTGQFEEEPPRGGWSVPDQLLYQPELDEIAELPTGTPPEQADLDADPLDTDPTVGNLEDEPGAPDVDVSDTSQAVVSCNKHYGTGYRSGTPFRIALVSADYKPAGLSAADAFYYMERAAARAGVSLQVNSGFRTMAQQRYLYHCYVTRSCNGGTLAARPGYSNHQSGVALDISTRLARTYTWLKNHARSFGYVRTVPSEPWHWEYRGARRTRPCH